MTRKALRKPLLLMGWTDLSLIGVDEHLVQVVSDEVNTGDAFCGRRCAVGRSTGSFSTWITCGPCRAGAGDGEPDNGRLSKLDEDGVRHAVLFELAMTVTGGKALDVEPRARFRCDGRQSSTPREGITPGTTDCVACLARGSSW